MHTTSFLTLLQPIKGERVAKRFHPHGVDQYDRLYEFHHRLYPIQSLSDLLTLLTHPAAQTCIGVLGAVREGSPDIVRRLKNEVILDPGNAVVLFDFDKIPMPDGHNWKDPAAAATALVNSIPLLANTSFMWQASSSAGKDGFARFHIWMIANSAIDYRHRKYMIKQAGADTQVAESNQPIYYALPTFDGVADPLADVPRMGIISQYSPTLAIPDIPPEEIAEVGLVNGEWTPLGPMSDEDLMNCICRFPRNRKPFLEGVSEGWSEHWMGCLKAACEHSTDQAQIYRVMVASGLARLSPDKSGSETRAQRIARLWNDEFTRAMNETEKYRRDRLPLPVDEPLLQRIIKGGIKEAFKPENMTALAAMRDANPAAYAQFRAELKACDTDVKITDLEAAMKKNMALQDMLGIDQLQTYFAGCVYLMRENQILLPNGLMIGKDSFQAMYGGPYFPVAREIMKERSAWTAFTNNTFVSFPKVMGTMFNPSLPFQAIANYEETPDVPLVNVYRPSTIRRIEGDPTPFFNHLRLMIPDERDFLIFVSWMAAMLQYVGHKFLWAPVLQGDEGNGKSTIAAVIRYGLGKQYCREINQSEILSGRTGFLKNTLFVIANEFTPKNKFEVHGLLRNMITEREQMIVDKYMPAHTIHDCSTNFLFTTNHKDSIVVGRGDRRYAPFFTAQQSPEDIARDGMTEIYFYQLWEWLRKDGMAIIYNYLMNFQIPDEFNPAVLAKRAPVTSSTDSAKDEALTELAQFIKDCVDEGKIGFRGGWVSSIMIQKAVEQHNREYPSSKLTLNRRVLKPTMESIGFKIVGKSPKQFIHEDNKRPILYQSGPVTSEYDVAQGYKT